MLIQNLSLCASIAEWQAGQFSGVYWLLQAASVALTSQKYSHSAAHTNQHMDYFMPVNFKTKI